MRCFVEVHFEFVGGSRDGQMCCSDSQDEFESRNARAFYEATKNGEVGRQFWIQTPYARDAMRGWEAGPAVDSGAFNAHWYEVNERFEESSYVIVQCRFLRSEPIRPADA